MAAMLIYIILFTLSYLFYQNSVVEKRAKVWDLNKRLKIKYSRSYRTVQNFSYVFFAYLFSFVFLFLHYKVCL